MLLSESGERGGRRMLRTRAVDVSLWEVALAGPGEGAQRGQGVGQGGVPCR